MKRLIPALFLALALALTTSAQDFDWTQIEAPDCDYGGNLQSIEAVDDYTVVFTFCNPDPAFASKAAFSALGIHPSEVLEATGGGGPELFQNPIGTGPYMLEQWDLGNEIRMTRYDDYWGDLPNDTTLVFRWNSEAASRLVELESGEADGIDNIGPSDFDYVGDSPDLQLFEREGLNVFYLGLNNFIEPLDNLLVRQAISHAIDKQRIIDNYYPPGSSVADQFMPPAIFGYTPEVDPFPYDLDRARELIEESGVETPIQLELSYRNVVRSYLPDPSVVAVDLQQQLAEIDVEVEIVEIESGAFLDASDAGELEIYLLGWGADYPDATNFLDFHFGAGASDQFGEKFDEITEPLTSAAQISDQDARYDFYVTANTAIRDFVPMVTVAHGGSAVAYSASVENPHVSPLGNEYFGAMDDTSDDEFVWVQNGEPAGIYCADETDGEALRVCEQINEPLLAYEIGGTAVVPALATEWESNEDATVWTFTLREGVTFHDGSDFTAEDVVASYGVQWLADSPLHTGRNGSFTYFSAFFGGFLNSGGGE